MHRVVCAQCIVGLEEERERREREREKGLFKEKAVRRKGRRKKRMV
jgi:hypothetical protein